MKLSPIYRHSETFLISSSLINIPCYDDTINFILCELSYLYEILEISNPFV